MNAANAIREMREMGFSVCAEGGELTWPWRGEGRPEAATVRPLLEVLKANKTEALTLLSVERPELKDRWWDVPGDAASEPHNVFDPACRLPDGVIFATECADHPECFIAYRVGARTLVGHGASQLDAVLTMADLELHL